MNFGRPAEHVEAPHPNRGRAELTEKRPIVLRRLRLAHRLRLRRLPPPRRRRLGRLLLIVGDLRERRLARAATHLAPRVDLLAPYAEHRCPFAKIIPCASRRSSSRG